jgi:hypothetical protein
MDKNINETVRFERKDINIRALAWIGAGLVVAAALLHLFLYLFYQGIRNSVREEGVPASLVTEQRSAPPVEPQLQANPVEDFKKFRAEENEKLNSYGWIDKEREIVRIPIEQAMRVILNRGLPKANQAAQTPIQAQPVTPATKQK